MRRMVPMLTLLMMLGASSLYGPAIANAQDATKDSLAKDPDVVESQQPEPAPQGPRSPSDETSDETSHHPLRDGLAKLRAAPPDLQGNPVPRPNQYASEPNQGGERTRSQDPSALSRDNQGKLPE